MRLNYYILLAVLLFFIYLYLPVNDKEFIKIRINRSFLEAEIADSEDEWTQGLSERKSLRGDQAMIFVFSEPRLPNFWMKNMSFPIDIIWADKNKQIIGTEINISPDSFPKTFSPPSPVMYVIEVNAGWIDKNNIKKNDYLEF